jgi:serine/threonine-protein kinase RsbT
VGDERRIPIDVEVDIVRARQEGRELARELGFSATECTLIATAISEVARNIIEYADKGEVRIRTLEQLGELGIQIVAEDEGPGINDVDAAFRDGYSTGGSLGMGLPGARRLMDEMEVKSEPGQGTRVTMRKWVP